VGRAHFAQDEHLFRRIVNARVGGHERSEAALGKLRHGAGRALRVRVGAPRQKTKHPQALVIPEMLRPILHDWRERHGRPTTGLVFPARRGKRAGEKKIRVSHARAFRRDLRRAFRVDRSHMVETVRSNGRKLGRWDWTQARDLTARERVLFTETEAKAVDRAFEDAELMAEGEDLQAGQLRGQLGSDNDSSVLCGDASAA
jgi:hypothetical protein